MSDHQRASWLQRLYQLLRGHTPARPGADRSVDVAIVPAMVARQSALAPRTIEDWNELVHQGKRVLVSWDGAEHAVRTAEGEVRLTFDETIWIWLDHELPLGGRPLVGQPIQVLTPRDDAMRLIPCRLLEESRGGSLQVAVSGRVSRLQRRDDVRARVDLPPASAVRLSPSGQPLGLLGVHLIDLSAGGIRLMGTDRLDAGDRLRLVLRLDDGQPLTPTVEVLVGGFAARGRFGPMPEPERRRIVQFVYRQELAERRRAQAAERG